MAVGRRFHLLPPRHARLSVCTQREARRDQRDHAIALACRDAGSSSWSSGYPEFVRDVHDVQHEDAVDALVADDQVEIAEGRRMRRTRQRRRQQGDERPQSTSDERDSTVRP